MLSTEIISVVNIWFRSWRCGCLVTWFCYQLRAKPGNKTTASLWPTHFDTCICIFEAANGGEGRLHGACEGPRQACIDSNTMCRDGICSCRPYYHERNGYCGECWEDELGSDLLSNSLGKLLFIRNPYFDITVLGLQSLCHDCPPCLFSNRAFSFTWFRMFQCPRGSSTSAAPLPTSVVTWTQPANKAPANVDRIMNAPGTTHVVSHLCRVGNIWRQCQVVDLFRWLSARLQYLLLTHWRYCSIVISHRFMQFSDCHWFSKVITSNREGGTI